CRRHRLGGLFSVALAAGLRLGEATGLQWGNIDLDTGEGRVRQQLQRVNRQLVLQPLKTEKSRRTLMLPAVCLDQLTQHRQRQLEERLKAGGEWCNRDDLVFVTYTTRARRPDRRAAPSTQRAADDAHAAGPRGHWAASVSRSAALGRESPDRQWRPARGGL